MAAAATPFDRALTGDLGAYEPSAWTWFASSARGAAASRVGRMLASITALAAAFARAPGLLLLVPAPFLALFVGRFLNVRVRQAALEAARSGPIRLPHPMTFYDVRVMALATRLARARARVRNVVRAGPRAKAFDLSSTLACAWRAERDAVVLLSRLDYVARALFAGSRARAEAHRSTPAAEGSTSRREAERAGARATLTVEMERNFDAVGSIVGALERLPIEIVRLQLKRLEACDGRAAGSPENGAAMIAHLRALRDAVNG